MSLRPSQIIRPFARPQEGHYTKFSNVVLDYLMPILPDSTYKVLSFLIRKTEGWGKASDEISYEQIKKGTGIKSNATISAALHDLMALPLTDRKGRVKKAPILSSPVILVKRGSLSPTNSNKPTASRYALNRKFEMELPGYDGSHVQEYASRASKLHSPNHPQLPLDMPAPGQVPDVIPASGLPAYSCESEPVPSSKNESYTGSNYEQLGYSNLEPGPNSQNELVASSKSVDTKEREKLEKISLFERDARPPSKRQDKSAYSLPVQAAFVPWQESEPNIPSPATQDAIEPRANTEWRVPDAARPPRPTTPTAPPSTPSKKQSKADESPAANICPTALGAMRTAICRACKCDLSTVSSMKLRRINHQAEKLILAGYSPEQVQAFGEDWPFPKPPWVDQVGDELPPFLYSNSKQKSHEQHFEHPAQRHSSPATSPARGHRPSRQPYLTASERRGQDWEDCLAELA